MPTKTNNLRLIAGSANPILAQKIGNYLNAELAPVSITHLADSEIHVQIDTLLREQKVYIIQPCSAPVNDHFMELVLLVDACRRASAKSITTIIPYYPYARQDRMANGREALSARVVATMLETMGVDRVLYVDIHALQIQGFFNIPTDPLTALPVLADYFQQDQTRFPRDKTVIVSPDVGRARLASKYADQLGLPLAVIHKRRVSFTETKTASIVGDIEGKTPILIDDMIAGGSVLDQIPALIEAGAEPPVYLSISHPVLLPSAIERLDREEIAELVTTDSIHHDKYHPKVRVQSLAPLLADAIRRIHTGQSLTPLLRLL
ncbi:MAG TPA: ribose-phosphate diphosphokinase [Anaerolineae bacterium]|nr:ribose-phosphate diphosphokinase [Anaerolineae bacterium]